MRLSGIKLAGFKSFVDPAQLQLPTNLTGVVGPNGCGKSNIIDAVRWVLGETSLKNLRSSDMEDVIFNGSKTRKPVGRASVELLFDNSDGQIGGPYAAYTEISVRREYMRDGNSQYYLNGAKCLKRDVTDLFLGTGLGGKNQYAIIEQGMVSTMITAKPEELRQWLEEAAGISKYKDRRKETESRIKGTRENLARLSDLRTELQQRLEALTKQAGNAEKFKEYKASERRLRAEILALRVKALEEQCQGHESQIATLNQALEEARARVHATAEARLQAEAAQREASHALNDEQSKVYEAEAAAARQEQSLIHARELATLKQRELEQMTRQIAESEQRQAREQARLEDGRRQIAEMEAQVQAAEKQEQDAQSGLIQAEDEVQAEQRRWDGFVQDAEGPLGQTEGLRVQVQQLERARFQGEERFKRLESEHAALNLQPIQASLFDADAELQQLNHELTEAQARLTTLDRDLQTLRDERSARDGALHEARQALAAARGRMASLETLQQAALRQDDADLSQWLQQNRLHDCPRLASAIQVEQGWEAAVEHVLEGLLQAPLLSDFAGQTRALGAPPKSGAALLNQAPGAGGSGLGSKLSGPQAVLDLLSSVQIAANAVEAAQRATQLKPGESVIAPDGIWYGRNWVRYPNTGEDRTGVLARGQLLKQLKAQIEAQTASVMDKEAGLDELRARMQRLELERRELAGKFDQSRGRQAQKMAFRQAQAVRLEQTQARVHALMQEIETLRTAREQQAKELEESRSQLTSLEATAQQLREQRAQLQQSLARKRDLVQRARLVLAQVQQARSGLQVQLAGRRSSLAALEASIADIAQGRQGLISRRGEEEKLAGELSAPLQMQAEEVEKARSAVAVVRDGLRAARERVEAAEKALTEAVQAARSAEQGKDAALEQAQQAKIEFENLRAHRESLEQQIRESGHVLEELTATLAANATLAGWEEELARTLRRIERLGPINLAAIQELEEAQARDKYLGEQYTDLHDALATLEEAIRKIDAETKELFKQTFDKVDAIFRDRFPKLFGGGEAYLEMTGDDLLDTGVRVMARPPGKRNSSIQLLSGGEKAMTAAALLLALFQLNPAPFCLMDEVDAPLDDANVGRFCDVVREMSQNVQFIIITHNKITMELVNQLHGVTMQEPGVSRLVSVDIAQAVELAGAKEQKQAAEA
jgi:chromosome segregation protein